MGKLTRIEIWTAICSKYPSLEPITINSVYTSNTSYVHRDSLFRILIEMKIHKSRHLTKEQKLKVNMEINSNMVDNL